MTNTKIMVAGVGNVFLGDDGFGVEVARRLSAVDVPGSVRVADYGIRGMHLAYDLAGTHHELTIIVDATARGDPPGTVSVIELEVPVSPPGEATLLDAHDMRPDVVLGLVGLLGGEPGRVLLVGCEPQVLDHRMELSPAVERAVGTAVRAVTELVARHPFDPASDLGEELACALASPEK